MSRIQKQSRTVEVTGTKPMSADEFKTAHEKGRRDFTNVVFERSANLWGVDFRRANLEGADLWGANLEGTNLEGTNLRRANLWGADLFAADLRGANLERADLGRTNLEGSDLGRANLEGADFGRANLERADLRGARYLELAYCLETAIFRNTKVTKEQEKTILEIQKREGAKQFEIVSKYLRR